MKFEHSVAKLFSWGVMLAATAIVLFVAFLALKGIAWLAGIEW